MLDSFVSISTIAGQKAERIPQMGDFSEIAGWLSGAYSWPVTKV